MGGGSRSLPPFERQARCAACGREYVVAGTALNPGVETEGPTRIRCACGGEITAFVPGSVNTERLVVKEIGEARPS